MASVLLNMGLNSGGVAPGWGPSVTETAAALARSLAGTQSSGELVELQLLRSGEGSVIERVYGCVRVGGHLLWTGAIKRRVYTTHGSKGTVGTVSRETSYFISFAVALCAGPITGVGRIWMNGEELDQRATSVRVHKGGEDQEPDATIIAETADPESVPAYRGLAYAVFTDFNITLHGRRIPQFNFEVMSSADPIAQKISAAVLLPSDGEVTHARQWRAVERRGGADYPLNARATSGQTDWQVALDQFQDVCPNAKMVMLRVAWFGTSLNADECLPRPRPQAWPEGDLPPPWRVGTSERKDTPPLSADETTGRSYFRGTPSDDSVLQAARDIKERGLQLMFCPEIILDIAPAFPHRNQITCSPAPGAAGSADGTSRAREQIATFLTGGSTEEPTTPWSYRAMIRHYWGMLYNARALDGMLLGSQLTGLARVRDDAGAYPFAQGLAALAQEIKTSTPRVLVSYGAHWKEYGAYIPPGESRVTYPLDDFWGSPHVDFVGLDGFFPLSDWRDGEEHLDLAQARTITDAAYLQGGVEGGEYGDWFYATPAARATQTRTRLDTRQQTHKALHFKALRDWWRQNHHVGYGGSETSEAYALRAHPRTAWTPQSKPIWLTALGCAAIDKASNEPDVAPRPHLADARVPHFSSGQRDDRIQREYLRAVWNYMEALRWTPIGTAPTPLGKPAADGAPSVAQEQSYAKMLAPENVFALGWDVRTSTALARGEDLWRDAPSAETGFVLNARLMQPRLAELLAEISDGRIRALTATHSSDAVVGYLADPTNMASALRPLLRMFFLEAVPEGAQFRAVHRSSLARVTIDESELVLDGERAGAQIHYAEAAELPSAVQLQYLNSRDDFAPAIAEARVEHEHYRPAQLSVPIVLEPTHAHQIADALLHELLEARTTLTLRLSQRYAALEIGDVLVFQKQMWRVQRLVDKGALEVEAVRHQPQIYEPSFFAIAPPPPRPALAAVTPPPAKIHLQVLDLPTYFGTAGVPHVAARADPFPPAVAVRNNAGSLSARVTAPSPSGRTLRALEAAPIGIWDYGGQLEVEIFDGELESRPPMEVLAGANYLALQVDDAKNTWELIQFVHAELIGRNRYRLTQLLRGQNGSDAAMVPTLPRGATVVALTDGLVPMAGARSTQRSQSDLQLRYGDSRYAVGDISWDSTRFKRTLFGRTPLAPANPRFVARTNGDIEIAWTRRSRNGADDWQARAPLEDGYESYVVCVDWQLRKLAQAIVAQPRYLFRHADYASRVNVHQYTYFRLTIYQRGAHANGYPLVQSFQPLYLRRQS